MVGEENKELEVKILNIDKKEVEKRLISLGAKLVFDGDIEDLFFDFPDKRLYDSGNVMRLRVEKSYSPSSFQKSILTYKSPISSNKVKEMKEIELEVEDFKDIKEILLSIGLNLLDVRKKHRTSYIIYNVRVDIDIYLDNLSYIPTFLEIEGSSIEEIYYVAHKLGYNKEDCKPWGFRELKKYYENISL